MWHVLFLEWFLFVWCLFSSEHYSSLRTIAWAIAISESELFDNSQCTMWHDTVWVVASVQTCSAAGTQKLHVLGVLVYRAISSLSRGNNSKTTKFGGHRKQQDSPAGPAALCACAPSSPAERSGRPGGAARGSPRAGRAPGVWQPRLTCSPGGSPSWRASRPRRRRAPGCAAARPSPPAPAAAPPARAAASRAPRTAPALKHRAQSSRQPAASPPHSQRHGKGMGETAREPSCQEWPGCPWETQRKGDPFASQPWHSLIMFTLGLPPTVPSALSAVRVRSHHTHTITELIKLEKSSKIIESILRPSTKLVS